MAQQPSEIAEYFVKKMNERHAADTSYGIHRCFGVQPGRKYDRIVNMEGPSTAPEEAKAKSVHAFIERSTGALVKSAGWSSPQKNADGTLSVRFSMTSDADVDAVVALSDVYGSYLYER